MSEYNGWTNRATWNVAMWLENDWDTNLDEWSKDREISSSERFRDEIQWAIVELDLRCWHLGAPAGCEVIHFMTPDAERFDDANWSELYESLIESRREEARDE